MYSHSVFTSESVCAGHPDKLCDQVSDAILDAVLAQDPYGRVAVETLAGRDRLIVTGEVTTTAQVDYEKIAREQIRRLGYLDPELLFTDNSQVEVSINRQSPEIAQGVLEKRGAGDQGMMFGFACKETPELMPLPIMLAHGLTQAVDQARETRALPYLRPDGKSQVTVAYENGHPTAVKTVVLAVPHLSAVDLEDVKQDLHKAVVIPILDRYGFSASNPELIVNGTGVWHFSGPAADTGLTGRKIGVDTYGSYARIGGGAFSGKDPSKVDRSGAYAARYIAKNIVGAGLADMVEVSLAYYIGAPQPIMKEFETFGTAHVSAEKIKQFVDALIDCSVEGIIETLQLRRPMYLQTAAYGHFGKTGLPWEEIKG